MLSMHKGKMEQEIYRKHQEETMHRKPKSHNEITDTKRRRGGPSAAYPPSLSFPPPSSLNLPFAPSLPLMGSTKMDATSSRSQPRIFPVLLPSRPPLGSPSL